MNSAHYSRSSQIEVDICCVLDRDHQLKIKINVETKQECAKATDGQSAKGGEITKRGRTSTHKSYIYIYILYVYVSSPSSCDIATTHGHRERSRILARSEKSRARASLPPCALFQTRQITCIHSVCKHKRGQNSPRVQRATCAHRSHRQTSPPRSP